MSPIDDELRAALHGRAQVLAPSPDPLAGIERRAKRIQRNRIGAAVAGSVLAVAAVAAVVPAIQTSATSGPDVPRVARSEGPQTQQPVSPRYALDPDAPWRYRGVDLAELGTGTLDTLEREFATKHGAAASTITPLFGQRYEPSQQVELVFLAEVDGALRWGVAATPGEGGPEIWWDEELPAQPLALAAALPGDEGVDRLLVIASPDVGALEYGADDATEFQRMTLLEEGAGGIALEGDPVTDSYRVLDVAGQELHRAPAPDRPAGGDEGAGTVTDTEAAAYAFDPDQPWEFRGIEEVEGNLAGDDERLFYETQPERRAISWATRPLYYGKSDAGMHYLFMLHTAEGQEPVVTTTWQRGDREAEQTEQGVEPGQKLLQAIVPTDLDDGSVMLVALASPKAGGIVLEQPGGNRPDGIGDPGVGLWLLDKGKRDGEIVLYTEGDGVEYYRNPVDVGPDAYAD